MQQSGFFAHLENILFEKFSDSNVWSGQSCFNSSKIFIKCINESLFYDQSRNEEHYSELVCNTFSTVRTFDLPITNETAVSFDKIVDLNSRQQQPAIKHLSDADIE